MQIGDGTGAYSTQNSGSDIIIAVGNGKITLTDAANLSNINIKGTEIAWQNDGTSSIKYQQGSETLFTINGLSTSDYLKLDLDNKVITVGESALWARAKDTITISDAYTFAFDENITAIYGTGGASGWYETLNNYVTFNIAGLSDYFTLEGGYSTITYHEETLGAAQVSLGGVSNYTSLADPTSTSVVTFEANNFTSSGVSVLGNSAAYQFNLSAGNYSGFALYGLDTADTITNNGSNITINGGAGNDYINNNGSNVSINGGEGADSIVNSGSNVSINGGAGDDFISNSGSNVSISGGEGKDLFVYTKGTNVITDYVAGEDVISLGAAFTTAGIIGSDYVFDFGSGSSLTLKDVKIGDELSVVNASGSSTTITALPLGLSYDDDKTALTASSLFSGGAIDLGSFSSSVVTVNAAALTNAVSITGNAKDNYLIGGSGADYLIGGEGSDSLTGNAGADTFIYDGKGADVITDYNAGEDIISLGGAFTTAGLSGSDYVFNFGSGSSLTLKDVKLGDKLSVINASGSSTTITALPKGLSFNEDETGLIADTLFADAEINLGDYDNKVRSIDAAALSVAINLVGNDYANTLTGGTGSDSLTGNGGADTFVYDGKGADVITDYKTGEDVISLGATYTTAGLSGNDYVFDFGSGNSLTVKDVKLGDKLSVVNTSGNFMTIKALPKGLSFNEKETGLIADTNFADTEINLGDYKNKVRSIDASALSSAVKLVGNNYSNTLIGGTGSDSLTGGNGNDLFVFGGGSDVITDYATGDRINLGGATVLDAVVNGNDLVLDLGNGNSFALSGAAKKKIQFREGNKLSYNYFGNHVIIDDTNTSATLTAAATEFNGSDFPTIFNINAAGVSTAIAITGNSKANRIYAGAGSATLNGGTGNDTLFGGAGIDTFVYSNKSGNKVIANYAAGETISLVGGTVSGALLGDNGDVILKVGSQTITVKGAKGKEIAISENGTNKYLLDGATYNADKTVATLSAKYSSTDLREFDNTFTTIDASAVNSKVNLKANSATGATLLGGKSNNTLTGGAGADYIEGGKSKDEINGGEGADTLLGGKGKDSLYGGAGDDSLLGEVGNDLLNGDDGNDYLDGGKGRDSLNGGAGADSLFGGEGGDKIYGGAGDDYIIGGKGNDSLWGEGGADTFVYASGDGKDVIFGFGNEDTLTFDNLELTSAKINSNGTEISLKVGTTSRAITLKEFTATEFNINGDVYTISDKTLVKK